VPAHVPLVEPAALVQLIAGLAPWLATVPLPAPAPTTVTVRGWENTAVTVRACDIVTTQLPVPVHAPLQPPKALPPLGVATSVTTVPDT